jgi:mannose-1-phosphate guanylyltransferase/mannose-6-phosphate isomerase
MPHSVRLYPVIMCGGSGTRLWPASRPARPKQFLPLVGERTLFAATVARVLRSALVERLVVVAGSGHAGPVLRELAALGVAADVLLEPEARDSGPAIAAAASWIATRDPQGIAAVLASDHHVPDAAAFGAAIDTAALAAAHHGRIVTLGIRPDSPSSAYGYIRPGAALDASVRALDAFVEKPPAATAQRYLDEGYLWNSGNFIAPASLLCSELAVLAPDVLAGAAEGVAGASLAGGAWLLGPAFAQSRRLSFDFAVMEKTAKAAVLPVDLAWSDLGAWDAVQAARPQDSCGNSLTGAVVISGCSANLIQAAPGMVVAVRGVKGLAVIAESDSVLVTPLTQAQAVKELVDGLRTQGLPQTDLPRQGPLTLRAAADSLRHWLFGSALPAWFAFGFDYQGWGAFEELDPAGRADAAPRRACVQLRQAWAFARAGDMGWTGPAGLAASRALDAIRSIYRQPDGRIQALAAADGTILDAAARLDDQALALLALSATACGNPGAEGEALALAETVGHSYAHDRGGLAEAGPAFLSRPLMHLLDAALAWRAAGQHPRWEELSDSLARHALARLIDPQSGATADGYGPDWTPLPGPGGPEIQPGHQFEWAWLLTRWWRASGDPAGLAAARRLYAAGAAGIDPTRGVVVDAMVTGGQLTERTARLGPQTGWLKAALILAEESGAEGAEPGGRARLVTQALQAVRAVQQFIPEELRGLWHAALEADGTPRAGPSPASALAHLVSAAAQIGVTADRASIEGWDAD